jgi:hypothetical protein
MMSRRMLSNTMCRDRYASDVFVEVDRSLVYRSRLLTDNLSVYSCTASMASQSDVSSTQSHPVRPSTHRRMPTDSSMQSSTSSKKRETKKSGGLFSFLTLKDPSTAAFAEIQQQARIAKELGKQPMAGLGNVSDAKLPATVPKVNSKWDGIPQSMKKKAESTRRGSASGSTHSGNDSVRSGQGRVNGTMSSSSVETSSDSSMSVGRPSISTVSTTLATESNHSRSNSKHYKQKFQISGDRPSTTTCSGYKTHQDNSSTSPMEIVDVGNLLAAVPLMGEHSAPQNSTAGPYVKSDSAQPLLSTTAQQWRVQSGYLENVVPRNTAPPMPPREPSSESIRIHRPSTRTGSGPQKTPTTYKVHSHSESRPSTGYTQARSYAPNASVSPWDFQPDPAQNPPPIEPAPSKAGIQTNASPGRARGMSGGIRRLAKKASDLNGG